MPTIEIIGLIAATLTTGAFIPQVYKVIKNKSTAAISLSMYTVLFVGVVLWLFYGIQIGSLAIILANSITGVLVGLVIFFKIKYK